MPEEKLLWTNNAWKNWRRRLKMIPKKIEIRGTGKPTEDLMTVSEPDGTRYLVFDKSIFPHLELGKIIDAEVELDVKKKSGEGTYNRIISITVEGKEIGGKKRGGFPLIRGRDEDRTDHRSGLITVKDLWLGGKLKDDNPLVTWLLAELLVIATGKKEVKDATKTNIKSKSASGQTGGMALELLPGETERARNFLNVLVSKGIPYPRLYLEAEYGLPQDKALSDKECVALYSKIKKKAGW